MRTLALVVLLACSIVACDRFVDLSPPPDAHSDGHNPDTSVVPDAVLGSDGGAIGDAALVD